MSSNSRGRATLVCQPLQSSVHEGFWWRLSSLKLDTLRIDDSPIPITGFVAPCFHAKVSKPLNLLSESLPPDPQEQSSPETGRVDRNKCPVPGVLVNTNTFESFKSIDRDSLLRNESRKILDNILSGKVEDDCRELLRFLVISFADLKKWGFHYWFAFPALSLDPHATLLRLQPAKDALSLNEAKALSAACNEWRSSDLTADVPFFLVIITSDSRVVVRPLKEWTSYRDHGQTLIFGFYDPCHRQNSPGWPLHNYLAFVSLRCNIDRVQFLCYRETTRGSADLGLSLIGEAEVSLPQAWRDADYLPEVKGWEGNASRFVDLSESMNPERLAVSAADLNLKLMRWRTFPSLDLNSLSHVRCLLLGAGTLGCQVARLLMAWGVRNITLVDSGRVSMSNPVRQSLYTFEDCLNGGDLKAIAAARSLKRIFPAVEAEGVELAIPMPGHPVPADDIPKLREICIRFQDLISSHDVVFLLTDTRESRWLPTLLCADQNKIAITAALGFDSYLVMRHGPGPLVSESNYTRASSTSAESMTSLEAKLEGLGMSAAQRLGCYFCNDVVAPVDSTSNRTLDQQCTVTRPGLAPIASALAVELLVGVLHHPNGIHAPGEIANSIMSSSEQPLGILPHQIRGLLPQYSQMTLIGHASNCCTACSDAVVSEYRRQGMEFVIQAINHPTYLEDLTGLTELKKAASSFDVDWGNDLDTEDGDDF